MPTLNQDEPKGSYIALASVSADNLEGTNKANTLLLQAWRSKDAVQKVSALMLANVSFC